MEKDYYPGSEYAWVDEDNTPEANKARKEGEKRRRESEKVFDEIKINDISMKLLTYSPLDTDTDIDRHHRGRYYVEFPLLNGSGDESSRWVYASYDLETAKKIFEEAKKIAEAAPAKEDEEIYDKNLRVAMELGKNHLTPEWQEYYDKRKVSR